jgi:hypothetical protein
MAMITRNGLMTYLIQSEDDSIISQPTGQINYDIEVYNEGIELYNFQGSSTKLFDTSPDYLKGQVADIFDRSGLYDLDVEFNPTTSAHINISDGKIQLDGSNIEAKTRTSNPRFPMVVQ